MTAGLAAYAAALAAGLGFGALYLAVLWAGVCALAGPRPAAAFLALAAARGTLVLGALALAFAAGAGASEIIVALVGFVAIRIAATRRAREGRPAWR